MQNENGSIILSKFLSNEIAAIYKKYSNISDDIANMIGVFVDKIEREKIDYDPYQSFSSTKALAEVLHNENNIEVVKLYIFLNGLGVKIELEETKDFQQELQTKGHVKIDNYILYFDYREDDLEARAIEILANDLENDEDRVADLFTLEEVSHMWVYQQSPNTVAKQYIQDNGWHEALNIEHLGVAYLDSQNSQVHYCLYEGSDLCD